MSNNRHQQVRASYERRDGVSIGEVIQDPVAYVEERMHQMFNSKNHSLLSFDYPIVWVM